MMKKKKKPEDKETQERRHEYTIWFMWFAIGVFVGIIISRYL